MSILQDPLRSITQAKLYLSSETPGHFPEANEIAAGNLCRQLLEQMLFVLCFYSRMPRTNFIRPDRTLRTPGQLLRRLDAHDAHSGKAYWSLAKERSPRIAKYARKQASLRKWARLLNEPSHFALKNRKVSADDLGVFVKLAESVFDNMDWNLITVAINEIFSNGKYTAQIREDAHCTPGLQFVSVVSARNLVRRPDGSLSIEGPVARTMIIPDDKIPRGPWPKVPVFVKGSTGFGIVFQLVNRNGNPINLTSAQTMIDTIAETIPQKRYLLGRLRKLGVQVGVLRDPPVPSGST